MNTSDLTQTVNAGIAAACGPAALRLMASSWESDQQRLEFLEDWAHRAAQELTEFCDAATEAMSSDDAMPGVRALIAELDDYTSRSSP